MPRIHREEPAKNSFCSLISRKCCRSGASTIVEQYGRGTFCERSSMAGRDCESFVTRDTTMAEQLDIKDVVTIEEMAISSMWEIAAVEVAAAVSVSDRAPDES